MPKSTKRQEREKLAREPVYTTIWRNKWLTSEATTLEEMAALLRDAANTLDEMAIAGVTLATGGMGDDYAFLTAPNEEVAKRFGFHEEGAQDDGVVG